MRALVLFALLLPSVALAAPKAKPAAPKPSAASALAAPSQEELEASSKAAAEAMMKGDEVDAESLAGNKHEFKTHVDDPTAGEGDDSADESPDLDRDFDDN